MFAQQKVSGVVIDKVNKQPIPFVSIGIIGKSVGTLSSEKGEFDFTFFENQKNDSVKIATIGYKPQVYLVADFVKDAKKNPCFGTFTSAIERSSGTI